MSRQEVLHLRRAFLGVLNDRIPGVGIPHGDNLQTGNPLPHQLEGAIVAFGDRAAGPGLITAKDEDGCFDLRQVLADVGVQASIADQGLRGLGM